MHSSSKVDAIVVRVGEALASMISHDYTRVELAWVQRSVGDDKVVDGGRIEVTRKPDDSFVITVTNQYTGKGGQV